jgi:hypothetical protein
MVSTGKAFPLPVIHVGVLGTSYAAGSEDATSWWPILG